MHMRSISHRRVSFSAHVCVEDMLISEADRLRVEIEDSLREQGIGHVLIQLESKECHGAELFCQSCAINEKGAHDHYSHGHDHGDGHAHGGH